MKTHFSALEKQESLRQAQLELQITMLSRRVFHIYNELTLIVEKLLTTVFEEDVFHIYDVVKDEIEQVLSNGDERNSWGARTIPDKEEHLVKLEKVWKESKEILMIFNEIYRVV